MLAFEVDPLSSAPAFSTERLEIVQESLGCSLPVSLVAALRNANGGVPVARFFDHLGIERALDRFLSIIDDYKNHPLGMYDIEVVWSQLEDRLGDGLVPIAALSNGDFLCLEFGNAVAEPRVVLWDHEQSEPNAPILTYVAQSFNELVEKLRT